MKRVYLSFRGDIFLRLNKKKDKKKLKYKPELCDSEILDFYLIFWYFLCENFSNDKNKTI